ncbi:hypothetical protein chiPu_0004814 [Chiloscyllium punctatum]|uniref:Uncharacterized protein n=1 Tax=Chiloscyllium punctatum TaxID=137246 RepID=A0A401S7L7_CHIPU|nr:hypothetical protein [Chiloscyllium punctatum]
MGMHRDTLWSMAKNYMGKRIFKNIQKAVAVGCMLEDWAKSQQRELKLQTGVAEFREEIKGLTEKVRNLQCQRDTYLVLLNQYQLQSEKLMREKEKNEKDTERAHLQTEELKE